MKAPLMRFLAASTATSLGDDEVDVTISTDQLARDGNIWIPSGCDLTDYRRNPVVLWQHRPDQPIGTASNLRVVGGSLVGRIKFAPLGVSATADTARGLMKSGVLCGISAGIEAVDVVPIDPAKPRGGQKITKWSLLEISAVSIPADTGAERQVLAGRIRKRILPLGGNFEGQGNGVGRFTPDLGDAQRVKARGGYGFAHVSGT